MIEKVAIFGVQDPGGGGGKWGLSTLRSCSPWGGWWGLGFGARRFHFLALTNISGKRHHFTLIGFLQPLDDDRGVQAT